MSKDCYLGSSEDEDGGAHQEILIKPSTDDDFAEKMGEFKAPFSSPRFPAKLLEEKLSEHNSALSK